MPGSLTEAETFLWYSVSPGLKIGAAYLHEQEAVRVLASLRVASETPSRPGLFVSAGVQGVGTGNPGFAATMEKNFRGENGTINIFAGAGLRTNENHAHPVAGFRLSLHNGISMGVQHDGHQSHPFVTYSKDSFIAGFYLVGGEAPGYMAGLRF